MVSLLADDDVPVLEHLVVRWQYDVLRLRDYDRNRHGDGRDDHEVLAEAIRQERPVLTCNRKDYLKLHRQTAFDNRCGGDHWGIVSFRQCGDWEVDAEALHVTISTELLHFGSLEGRFVWVDRTFQLGMLNAKRQRGV